MVHSAKPTPSTQQHTWLQTHEGEEGDNHSSKIRLVVAVFRACACVAVTGTFGFSLLTTFMSSHPNESNNYTLDLLNVGTDILYISEIHNV